ncbi:MAG: sigma-70 family RNA polymerase sigma factor [Acidobacteriota bacterium]
MEFDEREVVARVLGGDESAFNQILDRYQDQLFRLALRLTRNREDAEEVLQEALVRAFFNLSKFRGESSLLTWLYSITLRTGLRRRRQRARRDLFTTSVEDIPRDPASPDALPDAQSHDREIARHIDEAVLKLPRAQRAVFVLRHQEELTFREIGQHLGKSEGGVKALYFHAVRKMRKFLQSVWKE